jgi:methionyl-tRNA synthetase
LGWTDIHFNTTDHTISTPELLFEKMEKGPSFPLNLKVAKVIDAAEHPNAQKLLVLQLDLGYEKRQLVAGLKAHYKPEELVGKKIIIVSNLKPAKLRDVMSQGMLLAASDGETVKVLEAPESDPGEPVFIEGHDNNTKQITYEEFAKLEIKTKDQKALVDGHILKTKKEDVCVEIKDGCKIS